MVTQVRRNFQITLPAAIRKSLKIKVGDIVETTVKDGKIIIAPQKTITADQAWFWSKSWQEAEREAEEDIKAGRVKKFKSAEDLIKDLNK